MEGSGGFILDSSVLVDESEFGRIQSSFFPYLGLSSAHFWPKRFEVWAIWKGSNGFKVRFWCMNLGSSEFEVV